MALTAKQEEFCAAYLATGNAYRAYLAAYDAEKMKPQTVYVKASVLLKNDKIRVRLGELSASLRERAEISAEERMNRYAHLAAMAEASGDLTAAIRAEDSLTKIAGLFTAERPNDRSPVQDLNAAERDAVRSTVEAALEKARKGARADA